jgi:hypothetical protein
LSGTRIIQTMNLAGQDPTALTVTTCRNDQCDTAKPVLHDDAGTDFFCKMTGPLLVDCSFDKNTDGSVRLDLYVNGASDELKDGDVYSVKVTAPSGPPLLDVTKPVTYQVDQPVPGCPHLCRFGSIS